MRIWSLARFAVAAFAIVNFLPTQTQAQTTSFSEALTGQYVDLSFYEADKNLNCMDRTHFGDKAMAQALPAPEAVTDRTLLPFYSSELVMARESLLRVLNSSLPSQMPYTTARAQTAFDCWVESAEERWDLEAISACRSQFYSAMAVLGDSPDAAPMVAEPVPEIVTKKMVKATQPLERFMVFFDFDSHTIKPSQISEVDAAATAFNTNGDTYRKIAIVGHTDSSGDKEYNRQLSLKRAIAVKKALVDRKVKGSKVDLDAKGENYPLIETKDGAKEPQNRRVEIQLYQ